MPSPILKKPKAKQKGPTLVTLKDMAEMINAHFDVDVAVLTPYDWWKRTKAKDISLRLPPPSRYIRNGPYGSPEWLWSDIREWYKEYAKERLEELKQTKRDRMNPASARIG